MSDNAVQWSHRAAHPTRVVSKLCSLSLRLGDLPERRQSLGSNLNGLFFRYCWFAREYRRLSLGAVSPADSGQSREIRSL
jgi:hypothetical protein